MPEDKDGSDSNKASDDLFFFGWRQAALTFGMFIPFFARFSLLLARATAHAPPSAPSAHQLLRYICVWEGSIIGKELLLRCGQPRLSVGRSVDDRPLSSSFSLSRSATWHHISLVQNRLYVDYNYTNGVENDGLT